MNADYRNMLESPRVTPATRDALLRRLDPPAPVRGGLPAGALATLDALVRRLIPQPAGPDFIDLAARLDHVLAQGIGDGWRHADLPPDRAAYERGLRLLDETALNRRSVVFAAAEPAVQDELVNDLVAGELDPPGFAAAKWFADVLVAAAETYVSHPDTLARMGYSGVAFLPRWQHVGLNATQPWEPAAR